MKRFLLLAVLVGGLTLVESSSTAQAQGWGNAYGNYNGYGYRGWGRTYPVYNGYVNNVNNGYFPGNSGYFPNSGYGAYGYNGAYVGPVFNGGGAAAGVGITTGYWIGNGNPYYRYGSLAYPPAFYGW